MIGPADWNLSTNEWAGYMTAQWQPASSLFSPSACAGSANRCRRPWPRSPIPITRRRLCLRRKNARPRQRLGTARQPRNGYARNRWPVLRLGYGMYFGHITNATTETALTQTGSLKGRPQLFHSTYGWQKLHCRDQRRSAISLRAQWTTLQHREAGRDRVRAQLPQPRGASSCRRHRTAAARAAWNLRRA